MKALAIFIIRIYQNYISPYMPGSCRFYPSCSTYCIQAIAEHGLIKGILLFIKRIMKCHPLHPGGYDPVESSAVHCGCQSGKK